MLFLVDLVAVAGFSCLAGQSLPRRFGAGRDMGAITSWISRLFLRS